MKFSMWAKMARILGSHRTHDIIEKRQMDELKNGECMMISYHFFSMATWFKRHKHVAAAVGGNLVCGRRYDESQVRSGNNNVYIGGQTIADDLEEQITSLGEGI